ncbi:hypothetical protein PtB15_15B257 [Puccinia triticina]|nr:hypothetical protein PtB15_15B257 [Puccinia triticina]
MARNFGVPETVAKVKNPGQATRRVGLFDRPQRRLDPCRQHETDPVGLDIGYPHRSSTARTHILPSRPSPSDGSRRPMWVADIEDDRIRLMLAARVESSLRAIEQSDAACSLAWVLHFIDGLRHTEFRAIQGRFRTLRRTLLFLAYFTNQSAFHDL